MQDFNLIQGQIPVQRSGEIINDMSEDLCVSLFSKFWKYILK